MPAAGVAIKPRRLNSCSVGPRRSARASPSRSSLIARPRPACRRTACADDPRRDKQPRTSNHAERCPAHPSARGATCSLLPRCPRCCHPAAFARGRKSPTELGFGNAPERIRTSDLRFRRPRPGGYIGSSKPNRPLGAPIMRQKIGAHTPAADPHAFGEEASGRANGRSLSVEGERAVERLPQTTAEPPVRARSGLAGQASTPACVLPPRLLLDSVVGDVRRRVEGSATGGELTRIQAVGSGA